MKENKTFYGYVDEYKDYQCTISLNIENGKITNWNIYCIAGKHEITNGYEVVEYFLKKVSGKENFEDFENVNLMESRSEVTAGILYKPTNQIIGFVGTYDSWSGTVYDNKFVSDVKLVTICQLHERKIIYDNS